MTKRYVLFDLDGTLLDINMNEFLKSYFEKLMPFLKRWIKGDVYKIVMTSTDYMINEINGDLNQKKFLYKFSLLSGLSEDKVDEIFQKFYKIEFPKLNILGRPVPKAREILLRIHNEGYTLVLATNSLFPLIAVKERMKWAKIEDIPFSLITTAENMHYAKPYKEYYLEILDFFNANPKEAIMIGDDFELDISPAKSIGIDAYRIGEDIESLDEIFDILKR